MRPHESAYPNRILRQERRFRLSVALNQWDVRDRGFLQRIAAASPPLSALTPMAPFGKLIQCNFARGQRSRCA